MKENIREIYEMVYDRDYNNDGTMRPNMHLGRFEVVSVISEDCYAEEFIGKKLDITSNKPTGKTYRVVGREKSGIGGGTSYRIEEVSLCETCGQSLPVASE